MNKEIFECFIGPIIAIVILLGVFLFCGFRLGVVFEGKKKDTKNVQSEDKINSPMRALNNSELHGGVKYCPYCGYFLEQKDVANLGKDENDKLSNNTK